MRTKIGLTVTAIALLAVGCSGGGDSDSASDKPAPQTTMLPQKVAKPADTPDENPSPSPAADAPFNEQLAYELRSRTLKMADAPGKTTGDCPAHLESTQGTKVTCTTTYEGLKVTWDVTVGDKADWSDDYVKYEATPHQGILTRDGVASLLYGNFSPDSVRCNNIPEAVLVPLNVKTKYQCQTVTGKEVGLPEAVRATDSGPRSY